MSNEEEEGHLNMVTNIIKLNPVVVQFGSFVKTVQIF